MTQILLSGSDWQVKGYYGEDWRWRDAHLPVNRDLRAWVPATVPGTIQHDLWQAGETPNPYFERNSLLMEWIPARTWVYRKSFTLDAALKGQRIQLCFDGVDYEAEFFLNGHSLGYHVGMYTPIVFEVSELLNYGGENLLAVVVEPSPQEQPQVGRTSLVSTHKSRMTYWWDFCPRMVHQGIWQDVYLNTSGSVRIDDLAVQPRLSDDFQQATIDVTVGLDAQQAGAATIEIAISYEGNIVAQRQMSQRLSSGKTALAASLTIDQPRLWWPNGAGEQPLYDVAVQVKANGTVMDQAAKRIGLRKVELAANETSDPTARPYTFVVNGRRLYINGWNWVPMDVMYGVPRPDKLERLLTLAHDAHVNLLRVWGGGLIETEAFYNRCDELGLMVWQEFILSSSGMDNNPSDDDDFIDMLVDEAEQIIPRKRHHPALVLWCGGNELTKGDEQPLDDSHPLLAALKHAVNRLHPDALWLPTSPTGRVFSNSLANIAKDPTALHDTHGPWEYQGVTGQYTLYNAGTSLLHSEFGVEGLTNIASLNATIAPENQFPVTLDNPIWHHLGAWWVKEKVWRETFGEFPDIGTAVRATQLMQHDGLRYALEADRRRWPQSSGTLPWQFNEPFPMAACTSAVDYYGRPKPVYYAVKNAYAPVHVSAQFETTAWAGRETFAATIWGHNALTQSFASRAMIEVMGLDGQIYKGQQVDLALDPNSSQQVATFECALSEILSDVFFLNLALSVEGQIQHNRYSFTKAENLAPLLALPSATLSVEHDEAHNTLTIEHTGGPTALFVLIEDDRSLDSSGSVSLSDNYVCLQPHEARTIVATWHNVPPDERRLSVSGWNTNTWKG